MAVRRTTKPYAITLACALLALGSVASRAAGPTPVSGTISSDATWTAADSPYVLSGDVEIVSGASVTIEPGVTVLMNANASLTVTNGALSAQGLSDQPIVITSAAGTPRAGDWGALTFADGTLDSSSVLSHVEIRYGHGVVIESASPTIRDTQIDDHAAAAITLDLASSPTGAGLSATGNVVNGIVVPEGSITSNVVWGLKGIPYVVAEGTLDVGLPPFGLSPDLLDIGAGRSKTLVVNIPEIAQTDLPINVSSENETVAAPAGPVTIPAGHSSAEFTVNASNPGNTRIVATAGTFGTVYSNITVHPVKIIAPATALVAPELSIDFVVTLSDLPPGDDFDISIANSNTSVLSAPASVRVPNGTKTAVVPLTGLVESSTPVTLTFSANGYQSASTAVSVTRIKAMLGDSDGITLLLGDQVTLPVTLSKAAPAGGVVLNITASAPDVVDIEPAQVTVPAGQTVATSQVTLSSLAPGQTPVTLKSTLDVHGIDGTTLVTVPAPLELFLGDDAPAVAEGLQTRDQICVLQPLSTPLTVNLTSADPNKVSGPESGPWQAVIDPSTSCGTFYLRGKALASGVHVSFDAGGASGVILPADLVVDVLQPTLTISVNHGNNNHRIGEYNSNVDFAWTIPEAPDADISAFAEQSIGVSVVNATPADIVDGLHVLPGQPTVGTLTIPPDSRGAGLYLGSPVAGGSFQVAAQLGPTEWTSDVQQVTAPKFTMEDASFDIGRGLVATLYANKDYGTAGCANGSTGATVESSDLSKVFIDNIQDSGCQIGFDIHGVALTDVGQPVNVVVKDEVHGLVTYTLPVTVSLPGITFFDLEGVLVTGGADDFIIEWAGAHLPATDVASGLTVHLSAVDEIPEGILPDRAIVNTDTFLDDGDFLMPQGSRVGFGRVLGATGLGSYRISATLDGTQIGLSDTQSVATAVASFDPHERQIGAFNSGIYPVGHRLELPVTVSLRTFHNGELFTAHPDLNLVVQSRAEDFVHVLPGPITVPAGQSTANFVLEGVELTDEPVQIDVYIENGVPDPAPAGALLVSVIEPALVFNMPMARALNDPPSDITASWKVEYACENDGWGTCSPESDVFSPVGQSLTLSIIPDGTPSPVDGFQDTAGQPTTALVFNAEDPYSGHVYANPATSVGSYRVQAELGTSTWLSDPVVVGIPELSMQLDPRAGVGFYTWGRVFESVGGVEVIAADHDISVDMSCGNPLICDVDDIAVIPAYSSSANFMLRPLAVGSSTVNASVGTLSTEIDVDVVREQLCVVTQNPMQVGTTADVYAFACDPLGYAMQDIDIEFESAISSVISIDGALPDGTVTRTIPADTNQPSDPITIRALRTGTSSIFVHGDPVQSSASTPITVEN